jgi:hypothetical protein
VQSLDCTTGSALNIVVALCKTCWTVIGSPAESHWQSGANAFLVVPRDAPMGVLQQWENSKTMTRNENDI